MLSFLRYIIEESEDTKLKHIHHAEDRPILHGSEGFDHTVNALNQAHNHIKSGGNSSHLTMKYDGSPSIVFGRNPENGKFFVASKSAFNKNPKINYTPDDIQKNHGHAPGLVDKLSHALEHLPKVTPKQGVYQGDVMFSGNDVQDNKKGGVSFTPNTITYSAKGPDADKIKKSKFGVVVHTQYHGKDLQNMKADAFPNVHNFNQHPDVWHKSAELDTSHINYTPKEQDQFNHHIDQAKQIHQDHGNNIYSAIEPHSGDGNHLSTYINQTVRTGEKPSASGFAKHIQNHYNKAASKLKTPAAQVRKSNESQFHTDHITNNQQHYDNLFKMHSHLQKAKDILVRNLNQRGGELEHHIDNKPTDPEGFVVNHAGQPTKLVNRQEFSRANLLKVRK